MLFGSALTQSVAAVLSVLAAFVFVFGVAMQQKGNLAAMEARRAGTARYPDVIMTVTRPAWLVGMFVGGGVGFALLAVALRLGSLTVVEPLQVTQMLFTVPFSAWVARARVQRREWSGAIALVLGLGAAMVMVMPEQGTASGDPSRWPPVIAALVAASVVLALASRRTPELAAALLGAAAGLLFGLQGAMVKEITDLLATASGPLDVIVSPMPYAAVAATVAAVFLQNVALRAGRLAAAQTTVTTTGPMVSALIGVVVFGETLQHGPVRVLGALVGLGVCAWGVARLARSPALVAAHELTEGAASADPPTAVPQSRS